MGREIHTATGRVCFVAGNHAAAHCKRVGIILCIVAEQADSTTIVSSDVICDFSIARQLDAGIALPINIRRIRRYSTAVSSLVVGDRTARHDKCVRQVSCIGCTDNRNRTAKGADIAGSRISTDRTSTHGQFGRSVIRCSIVCSASADHNCAAVCAGGTINAVDLVNVTNGSIVADLATVDLHFAAEIDSTTPFGRTAGDTGAILHRQFGAVIYNDAATPVVGTSRFILIDCSAIANSRTICKDKLTARANTQAANILGFCIYRQISQRNIRLCACTTFGTDFNHIEVIGCDTIPTIFDRRCSFSGITRQRD